MAGGGDFVTGVLASSRGIESALGGGGGSKPRHELHFGVSSEPEACFITVVCGGGTRSRDLRYFEFRCYGPLVSYERRTCLTDSYPMGHL